MATLIEKLKTAVSGRRGEAASADGASLELRVERHLTAKWQDLRAAYWVYHSWIWESLLMYAGQVWIKYNNTRNVFEPQLPADEFVPQPRVNRFAAAIDAVASNFQAIPEIEAVPTPIDDVRKIGIAEVCNELARHFIKDTALRVDYKTDEDKSGIAGQWFTLAGCFFTNVYTEDREVGRQPVMTEQPGFNAQCLKCDQYMPGLPEAPQACPQCGNPGLQVQPGVVQVPQIGEDGKPVTEPITEKHVLCDVESPLAAYPRAGAKTMKDTNLFILAERMDLDRIWRDFGIDAQPDNEQPDGWNIALENSLRFFYEGYSTSSLTGKDGALVLRAYCEPGKVKEFPEGFFAIYVNGRCKRVEPWTFVEHPLTKADFKVLPTLFFPRCMAFDLTGIVAEQRDYKSIIKLHAMVAAVDPVVADENTKVTEITGRADQIIWWRSLGPGSREPHRMQHGTLDEGVYRMDDKLDKEFEVISQAVGIWRGEQPSGVTAGVALETLRSQAEFMFSGPTASFNGTWRETVRKGVKTMQKSYTVPQLMAIVGENHATELQDFVQCDLDSAVEWVTTRNGMPRTRDERRQEMISLYDRGLLDINDPGVRQKGFELFGETGMLGSFNKDATRARMENSRMKAGQPALFMPEVDDNAVHLAIHADDIKSADFLKRSPAVQQLAIAHYMETKQALAMQAPPPAPGTNVPPGSPAQSTEEVANV